MIALINFKRRKDVHIDSLGISGSPYLYNKWLTFLTDTKMSGPNDKIYQMEVIKPQNKPSKLLQPYGTYEEAGSANKNKIFIGWLINTYG